MSKYHAFKNCHGDTPDASMKLWREEAEAAYWQANDPHFVTNIPPDILRSYEPGTIDAFPTKPELAGNQAQSIEDVFDASDSTKAAALTHLPKDNLKAVLPRNKQVVSRQENFVENALRRDGTVLQYFVRPYTQWSCFATTATPLAMQYVPARGRGKVVSGGNEVEATAAHVSVQRKAFEAHPIALMLFPEKFDEMLVRSAYAPRVLSFAKELTKLYGRWIQHGNSFGVEHHSAIDDALRESATSGAMVTVPLISLMERDPKSADAVKAAMTLHSDDPLAAAHAVLDFMQKAEVGYFDLPEGLLD